LFSLDATVVSLCLSLFPWARFRRTKGGIKLPTLLDHDGYLPAFVAISAAREHEVQRARSLRLPQGSIVVEDMGYTDYDRYAQLTAQKIFFVTRQKRNARYEVLERRKVNKKQGLLSDQTIRLQAQECPLPLRRIAYRDAATGRRYVFLTNHFKLAAKTIADIYKERWQIEIFFRFIKQNLKIKAFIGNSENAVMSQIYAALIVYLLLCYTKFLCNLSVTLQNLMRVLQLNLFRTCPLPELFEPPGPAPNNMNLNSQLCLAWA
jgi:putative transposase